MLEVDMTLVSPIRWRRQGGMDKLSESFPAVSVIVKVDEVFIGAKPIHPKTHRPRSIWCKLRP